MTLAQLVVIGVAAIPLGLIATNRIRLDVAAMSTALTLALAQMLGLGVLGPPDTPNAAIKSLSGLAEPVTVTMFSLFVITRGLEKTGIMRWLARRILKISGSSESRLIGLLSATTALFSLFMTNLAAGALVLPSAMEVSRRTKIRPSKLLIPVAFGACLGGAATYFTSANIIASDLLRAANPPQAPLRILDFTAVGGLIAIAGIIYLTVVGRRVLPNREPSIEQAVARRTGTELEAVYQLAERLWEVKVPADSKLVNLSLVQAGIGERFGLAVLGIAHGRQSILAPSPDYVLQPNDLLLIIGREDRLVMMESDGVVVERESTDTRISPQGVSFQEVVLSPESRAEGRTLKELDFRRRYGFTAVALRREGRSYRTDVADFKLRLGDSILVVGVPENLKLLQRSADFLVLESDPADQPVHWRTAAIAIGVTGLAIGASILGFPVYMATMLAAVFMLVWGLLTMEEVYRKMEWQAIILIAGMYPVSLAMVNTGLAESLGKTFVSLIAPFGPLGLVGGAYLLTGLLSQVIAGQVTTLITAPVLISAAISLGTNPQAVAVAAAIACSAFFMTPIAHPVNTLMIGPANYKFTDFGRAGLGLTVLSFIMLLIGMSLFWKL